MYVSVKCTLVQALRLCTGRTDHRGSRGIALLFLDHGTRRGWGVSVTPRPLFTPGKTRYPLYTRMGGPQDRSGQVRKISPPPGFDPQIVQPVASRYTDWVSRPTRDHYFQTIRCMNISPVRNNSGNCTSYICASLIIFSLWISWDFPPLEASSRSAVFLSQLPLFFFLTAQADSFFF